jgi:hypothetical protein
LAQRPRVGARTVSGSGRNRVRNLPESGVTG